ncbi:polysaccharide pyruvyl transferase family protein [Helicobacter equorum]
MLLSREDYLSIATRLKDKKDVFVYMLGQETLIDKNALLDFIQERAEILYANANIDSKNACLYDVSTDFYPTPSQWIGAIADSRFMVTNSFHGCVFAIIMNTPFLVLKLGGSAGSMNTRFETLLEIFNLQDCLCASLEEFMDKFLTQIEIDWQEVNARLYLWSQVGKDYLAKNVGIYAI